MKIYAMTATFGKLERQTLTLEPGLNIIHAPNEWGKSTWCAFLEAMFYGIDTRAKTTKTTLADKEHYAPWSGTPMEGRIDLNWQGRDITIERKTKRRVPLGEFRAYETHTGLAVPELDGTNCGAMLLGVERSVFLRSGYVRFRDLPVSQDEALRRRLNALVTTGDESLTADRLSGELQKLKNSCRYNKSGLLPNAERERDALEAKLRDLDSYSAQCQTIRTRLEERKRHVVELENHKKALKYDDFLKNADQLKAAEAELVSQAQRAEQLRESCRQLPSQEQLTQRKKDLQKLGDEWVAFLMDSTQSPAEPEPVQPPVPFRGMTAEEAAARAEADGAQWKALRKKNPLLLILGFGLLVAGGVLAVWYLLPGLICAGAGAAAVIAALVIRASKNRKAGDIAAFYGADEPERWLAMAAEYGEACRVFDEARQRRAQWETRREQTRRQLEERITAETGSLGLEGARREVERMERTWDSYAVESRELCRAEKHVQTLRALVTHPEKPAFADELTWSEAETARLLSDAKAEQNSLENQLGQYQGKMEALGRQEELEAALRRVRARIRELEQTNDALILAQQTLTQAAQELQRRFSPRITKRAQELMSVFTGGRYERMNLQEDLTVLSATAQEPTMREVLWRSDGTMDQLYLSLRLAVAEELTPDAPLILDDALVRFDDDRLKAALKVLKSVAEDKQVILFTCHSREAELLE